MHLVGSSRGERMTPTSARRTCPDQFLIHGPFVISPTIANHISFGSRSLAPNSPVSHSSPTSHSVFSPIVRARGVNYFEDDENVAAEAGAEAKLLHCNLACIGQTFPDYASIQAIQVHNRRRINLFSSSPIAPNSLGHDTAARHPTLEEASPCVKAVRRADSWHGRITLQSAHAL